MMKARAVKLLVATDAWKPQVNGVVKTFGNLIPELARLGIETDVINPNDFPTAAMPGYGEIRLAWPRRSILEAKLDASCPDHIHIATEGPIGWAMRRLCLKRGLPFTTSYHTRFPEYLAARAPVPLALSYSVLKRFHNAGNGIMVATPSIRTELEERGFQRLMNWGRGVDLERFNPQATATAMNWPRPVFVTVGRLAPEKNLEAFLALDLPGTKVVIGDGPSSNELRERYRQTVFLGSRSHDELPGLYAQADVFVFPSLTDTFGLVLIEALACGVPVAAFPVAGPRDVIGVSDAGVLDNDLKAAALAALRIERAKCREHALGFTWAASAAQFKSNIESVAGTHKVLKVSA